MLQSYDNHLQFPDRALQNTQLVRKLLILLIVRYRDASHPDPTRGPEGPHQWLLFQFEIQLSRLKICLSFSQPGLNTHAFWLSFIRAPAAGRSSGIATKAFQLFGKFVFCPDN